jgi:hypothetical protein
MCNKNVLGADLINSISLNLYRVVALQYSRSISEVIMLVRDNNHIRIFPGGARAKFNEKYRGQICSL